MPPPEEVSSKSVGVLLTRQEKLKRIRDINRLLSRKSETLPKEAQDRFTALRDALQKTLDSHKIPQQRETQTAGAKSCHLNHKLRFFELKKVQARLRQRRQKLLKLRDTRTETLASSDEQAIQSEMDSLQQNLLYIQKFPDNRRYISVFLNKDTADIATKELIRCRERIKARIIKQFNEKKSRTGDPFKNGKHLQGDLFSLTPVSSEEPPAKPRATALPTKKRDEPPNNNAGQSSHIMFDDDDV